MRAALASIARTDEFEERVRDVRLAPWQWEFLLAADGLLRIDQLARLCDVDESTALQFASEGEALGLLDESSLSLAAYRTARGLPAVVASGPAWEADRDDEPMGDAIAFEAGPVTSFASAFAGAMPHEPMPAEMHEHEHGTGHEDRHEFALPEPAFGHVASNEAAYEPAPATHEIAFEPEPEPEPAPAPESAYGHGHVLSNEAAYEPAPVTHEIAFEPEPEPAYGHAPSNGVAYEPAPVTHQIAFEPEPGNEPEPAYGHALSNDAAYEPAPVTHEIAFEPEPAYGHAPSNGLAYEPAPVTHELGFEPEPAYGHTPSNGATYEPAPVTHEIAFEPEPAYGHTSSNGVTYEPAPVTHEVAFEPEPAYGHTPSNGVAYEPAPAVMHQVSFEPEHAVSSGMPDAAYKTAPVTTHVAFEPDYAMPHEPDYAMPHEPDYAMPYAGHDALPALDDEAARDEMPAARVAPVVEAFDPFALDATHVASHAGMSTEATYESPAAFAHESTTTPERFAGEPFDDANTAPPQPPNELPKSIAYSFAAEAFGAANPAFAANEREAPAPAAAAEAVLTRREPAVPGVVTAASKSGDDLTGMLLRAFGLKK